MNIFEHFWAFLKTLGHIDNFCKCFENFRTMLKLFEKLWMLKNVNLHVSNISLILRGPLIFKRFWESGVRTVCTVWTGCTECTECTECTVCTVSIVCTVQSFDYYNIYIQIYDYFSKLQLLNKAITIKQNHNNATKHIYETKLQLWTNQHKMQATTNQPISATITLVE